MRPALVILAVAAVVAGPAAAASRTTLAVDNGATPFAGDRADLTTISPNGDGYRDGVRIRYTAPEAGFAQLRVVGQDRRGKVVSNATVLVDAGENTLTWTPSASIPQGTYVVRVGTASAVVRVQGIDAAAGRAGYAQGEVARVAVATDARRLTVDVLRVDTGPTTRRRDTVEGTVVGRSFRVGWSTRTDHPHNVSVPIGLDWPSGVYFVRFSADDGRVGFAPIVVRPRRLGGSRIAVVMPTNTWQAYNFYDRDGDGRGDTWYAAWRLHATRLGRPYLNRGVPPHFAAYDLPFLRWLTAHHVAADFLTDSDLQAVGGGDRLIRLYDLVVFPGHHEYVTGLEYEIVRRYRDLGGNLAWLSANNFFWKVVRRGPVMERVAQWRRLGRPEASLIGVQYRGNDEGERRAAMTVTNPDAAPWLFAGTPLAAGGSWGRFGIEIDARAPSSPHGTTVLASVPNLYGPGFTAQMTYYETAAGAKVFAAGAFTLAGDAWDPATSRLLANLLAHLEVP